MPGSLCTIPCGRQWTPYIYRKALLEDSMLGALRMDVSRLGRLSLGRVRLGLGRVMSERLNGRNPHTIDLREARRFFRGGVGYRGGRICWELCCYSA